MYSTLLYSHTDRTKGAGGGDKVWGGRGCACSAENPKGMKRIQRNHMFFFFGFFGFFFSFVSQGRVE